MILETRKYSMNEWNNVVMPAVAVGTVKPVPCITAQGLMAGMEFTGELMEEGCRFTCTGWCSGPLPCVIVQQISGQRKEIVMQPDLELPAVAGIMACSNDNLEHRCLLHLKEEQDKILPNNALIATLCDAVRCIREYNSVMQHGNIIPPGE